MQRNDSPDRYGLVGHPVAHSKSPLIHQLFARQLGQAQMLSYELIDAEPADLEVAVRGFGAAGGKGLNVTIPHKEAAFELVDDRGPAATEAGAVNTITFKNSRLRGDNTDGIGLIRDVTVNQGQPLDGKRVLILGAGGSARGIVAPIAQEGPAEIVIANRTLDRAEKLVEQFRMNIVGLSVMTFADLGSAEPFDVVFNATAAGLKGEPPPFPVSLLAAKPFCYDLVYSLHDTPFVAWARQHGARAVQGWGMLVEQAAESFYIWRGVRPDTAPLLKQLGGASVSAS
jgi:shikimate dehydrogenase